ncbi:MAG: amidase, partial [Gaiellales bacterium]
SVRIPAAFCGVTGMRPTTGLVSTRGVLPTSWSLDAVGPLAWSAEECEQLLETMAGRSLAGGDVGDDLRVGVLTGLFDAAEPAVAEACARALAELPGEKESVSLPLHEEISTITQLIMLPEATNAHLSWLRTRLGDYGGDVRARLLAGLLLPSTAYATGLRARRWARAEYERALGGYDVLVAPAVPITAPRLDSIPEDYRLLIMPYNSPAALLGLPAVVAPCGFVEGLPVALALTGRPGEDGTPLAAAKAFQQVTDWHEQRPERSLARVA